jgi:pimeloyl-ACP methyl ester carboxylesterase
VVLSATGPDRAPDPLVYFAGGPGDSAVDLIAGERSLLADLNVHRDLVFIEQRGTGRSNPLTCPAFPGLADKPAVRASAQSCLPRVHGDIRFYTTAMYADDVNQVLSDLRYATANFVGISYGTTAEQVFLLRHPARVRTMTLISGTPLNVPLLERLPGNTQLALDHVFGLCGSQPACHQAFPHLAADWAALWASLGKSPWVLPAAQSPTKTTQRLDQDALASVTYNTLYDGTILGNRVIVHGNAVLGGDGFGYRFHNGQHVKVPQLGHVELGDDVEVGACTTIDRGTFQATKVGAGTKLDNLKVAGIFSTHRNRESNGEDGSHGKSCT